MEKTKQVKSYTRRTKSGKTITVKAYTAKYDSGKNSVVGKPGSGDEFKDRRRIGAEKVKDFSKQIKDLEQQRRGEYTPSERRKLSEKISDLKLKRASLRDRYELYPRPIGSGTNGPVPKKKSGAKTDIRKK